MNTFKLAVSGIFLLNVCATAAWAVNNSTRVINTTAQPGASCVTALTQYGVTQGGNPTASSQANNTITSIPMSFASVANGGMLCPGKYTTSAFCVQNTSGGCGGNSCGWNVWLYTFPSNTLIAGQSSVIAGCTTTHGNPCQSSTVWLGTNSGTYDTNLYTAVYMQAYSESNSATMSFCSVTMKLSQAY